MKITYITHACLLIEVKGVKILTGEHPLIFVT